MGQKILIPHPPDPLPSDLLPPCGTNESLLLRCFVPLSLLSLCVTGLRFFVFFVCFFFSSFFFPLSSSSLSSSSLLLFKKKKKMLSLGKNLPICQAGVLHSPSHTQKGNTHTHTHKHTHKKKKSRIKRENRGKRKRQHKIYRVE
ncbi:uncharacterized protein V6R79_013900 [Siganus canaliculatus]